MLWGLDARKWYPTDGRGSPACSSPGPGRPGSLRFRFMATLDLRRSLRPRVADERLRVELVDERRESSF